MTVICRVMIAVLGAATSSGGSKLMDWKTHRLGPEPPLEAIGTLTFDHYDGDSPPDALPEFTSWFDTLILRDDKTYSATCNPFFPTGVR